ncbi:hypothetical protein EHS25_007449 [Saitozyma podzolica]|uniref:Uncharacterized protein n=1 Tax=Saitozyma podzolica TaxID=1890683 RepID=A0A427YPX4_9TREE|nr:hypothetical protein EHS25_007449 [Saitozyma podzolica]
MPSALKPLTPLALADVPSAPKLGRSQSISSTSSVYSRSADDMLDRLAAQQPDATFHLWSAGNVRLNNLDLTIPAREAAELVKVMRGDERFEVLTVKHLGEEGDDWKISYRRTTSPATTPLPSDSE